jgi:hypothetical protein
MTNNNFKIKLDENNKNIFSCLLNIYFDTI